MPIMIHDQNSKTVSENIVISVKEFFKAQVSAFVGGIIDYLVMVICIECFDIALIPSIIFGGVIGAIFNFTINRCWTFKSKQSNILNQIFKFKVAAATSIFLKAFGTLLLTKTLGLNYKIARLIADALVCFGFNFIIQKLWVFKK